MEDKIDVCFDDEIIEIYQERLCEICEAHIIEGSSNSQHYQCEGSRCHEALPHLIEELENEKEEALSGIISVLQAPREESTEEKSLRMWDEASKLTNSEVKPKKKRFIMHIKRK